MDFEGEDSQDFTYSTDTNGFWELNGTTHASDNSPRGQHCTLLQVAFWGKQRNTPDLADTPEGMSISWPVPNKVKSASGGSSRCSGSPNRKVDTKSAEGFRFILPTRTPGRQA